MSILLRNRWLIVDTGAETSFGAENQFRCTANMPRMRMAIIAATCVLLSLHAEMSQAQGLIDSPSGHDHWHTQAYAQPQYVHYTVVYDQAGQAFYVPVQQTSQSAHHGHRHAHSHHSHASVFAPAIHDTRDTAADVADLALTLHPGAWLAEGLGLINRDRIVDQIRGYHRYDY